MSARLDELRQQRALLQEHLAWLDREIAREANSNPATTASAPPAPSVKVTLASPAPVSAGSSSRVAPTVTTTPASAPLSPLSPLPGAAAAPAPADSDPDAILEKYRPGPDSLRTDVRKGCFLYFFGALALFAGGVALLYFVLRR